MDMANSHIRSACIDSQPGALDVRPTTGTVLTPPRAAFSLAILVPDRAHPGIAVGYPRWAALTAWFGAYQLTRIVSIHSSIIETDGMRQCLDLCSASVRTRDFSRKMYDANYGGECLPKQGCFRRGHGHVSDGCTRESTSKSRDAAWSLRAGWRSCN